MSADFRRFYNAYISDIGRGVSLEDAARWATWLPPDAVTWIAMREGKTRAEQDADAAETTKTRQALQQMRDRRARELAAMKQRG